jgi:hypothetical protein
VGIGTRATIGPYFAWRVGRSEWPWVGFRANDHKRSAVDIAVKERVLQGTPPSPHPSLSRVIDGGVVPGTASGDAQRFWVREHAAGVELAVLLRRTAAEGAAMDVDMACWLAESVGGASLAALAHEWGLHPGIARVVVRWDGMPLLLESDGAHALEAVAFQEWKPVSKAHELVVLLARCLDPKRAIVDTLRSAALPERVRRIALDAYTSAGIKNEWNDLVAALTAARTLDVQELQRSWAGLVAHLAPEERAAHDALLEEIGAHP